MGKGDKQKMNDHLEIGPSPYGENCAQVGDENFRLRASDEMNVYINQLNRMFGNLIKDNRSIYFSKKWFPHDFGTYGEVVINFDDEKDYDVIYEIERNLPEYWDDEAKKQLDLLPKGIE